MTKEDSKKLVLFQPPNVPLIVWGISAILARVLPSPTARMSFGYLATIAITVWALLELFWGVNYVRRLMGAVVLISVVVGLFA